jgi:TPR repeat protein
LLVCFFLAGAVAGLGSAYVAGAERIVDGTIEHARTALSFLTGTATWRANQTRYGPAATRSATEGAANDIETAAAAIVVKSGDGEQARDSEGQGEPSPVESWRPDALPQAEDVPPLSAGAAAKEMVSDGAHSTAMVSPSIKDQSLAMASFALLRGDEAMRQRDVIAARRFYEFAASAGVARAATAVGRTYDPLYLRGAGVRGLPGDATKARQWYEQGAQGGDAEACARVNQLLGTTNESPR